MLVEGQVLETIIQNQDRSGELPIGNCCGENSPTPNDDWQTGSKITNLRGFITPFSRIEW